MQELKASSAELNDLRLNKERLEYDNKEAGIQIDTLQEQISEHERELDELRRQVEQLRTHAKDAVAEEKERRKAEKMAAMMAKFDAVRRDRRFAVCRLKLMLTSPYLSASRRARCPKRKRAFGSCSLSSMPLTTRTLRRRSLKRTSHSSTVSFLRARRSFVIHTTDFDRLRRMPACSSAVGRRLSSDLERSRPSMRSFSVRSLSV